MKKIFYLFIILVGLFINTPSVFAHDQSQPHFFKINGEYINYNSVTTTSLHDFILPQEIDPNLLTVNNSTKFLIEKWNIPLNYKSAENNDFYMDFGDGVKQQGLSLEHSYSYQGSYIITLSVKPVFVQKEIIFDTILVYVLSNDTQKIPLSIINVNDESVNKTSLNIDFNKPISLDGTNSSSGVTNYFWDLGDGNSTDSAKISHNYSNSDYGVNIVLRVRDNHGFIADSTVRLNNINKSDEVSSNISPTDNNKFIKIGLILVLITCGLIYIFRKKIKSIVIY